MAVRISGVNLQDKKNIRIALTDVYGIGWAKSGMLLRELNIEPTTKVRDLTGTEENAIRDYIEQNFTVEGELRREIQQNVKHMIDVGTYKGSRHAKRLPVRGQRTKTNSRTVRGNVRKTAGSGKKKAEGKT